jgi:O-antigen/teichoic acid export membrane protein
MKREFAINIVLLLLANLCVKAFYLLGIDRQMQLAVGTEPYGLYYTLFSFTLIFQFVNDFGIQNYTNRFASQNREEIKLRHKDFAGLKILLSFFYIIGVFLFAWIMDYSFSLYPFIFHLACNQILVSFIFFIRSNISGLGFYKTDSFFSILDRLLLIILGSILLWHPYFRNWISIESFVWIQSISLFITLCAVLVFIKSKHIHLAFWNIEFDQIKKILIACLPFAMIYLFSSVYSKIDVVLLGKLLEDGDHQVGIYAASMRLFEASSMISLSFGSLLLAMFSAVYKDSIKLTELFKVSLNILIVITVTIVLMSVMYSREIMLLLYKQNNPYWTQTFQLVMISFMPASINYIMGALLPAVHQEKKLYQMYFLGSFLSILLNLILITQWKLIGAAMTAIIIHSVLFAIQFYYVKSKKYLLIDRGFYYKIILFILFSTAVSYGIYYLELSWLVKICITIFAILLLSLSLKLISIKEILESRMTSS